MRILLSNDDGYLAPGLSCLAEALAEVAEITVVAPERNHSGSSNSLTLMRPLRVYEGANGYRYVDGTPTDCVHLAITGLMDNEPDMVIAGINHGSNLGDDVLYSGTVAAAMEGRFLGYPALAVSIAGATPKHFATAARVVCKMIEDLGRRPLPNETILNINIPDVAYSELEGICATRLGHRQKSEPAIHSADPLGKRIYWVGSVGAEADAGAGTDFHAVKHNSVSVTPLKVDLTRHESLTKVGQWLEHIER